MNFTIIIAKLAISIIIFISYGSYDVSRAVQLHCAACTASVCCSTIYKLTTDAFRHQKPNTNAIINYKKLIYVYIYVLECLLHTLCVCASVSASVL